MALTRASMFRGFACTVDDDGVFFADFDTLGFAELSQSGFLERHASLFSDYNTAGEDGHVL
jgi:hypothetical protein